MNEFSDAFKRLSSYEKMSAVLLGFFGIAAIFLGVLQMKNRILTGGGTERVAQQKSIKQLVPTDITAAELAAIDTDQDGLSDQDEINLYKTSPYLVDSDSDGFFDADEVAAGENPNCPRGESCLGLGTNAEAYSANGSAQTDVLSAFNAGTFDAEQVRQQLVAAGVPEKQLSQLTDAQLQALYLETMQETDVEVDTLGLSELAAGGAPSEELLDEVRVLLVQSGLTEEEVASLSQEQLMQIIQEVLKQSGD